MIRVRSYDALEFRAGLAGFAQWYPRQLPRFPVLQRVSPAPTMQSTGCSPIRVSIVPFCLTVTTVPNHRMGPRMQDIPERQIRAAYDDHTIRVYQAYSVEIADAALDRGTFVSPPFSMSRMTWIKPSFLWMMYRAGWGDKDPDQRRILAIDISREGFDWALAHSCPSHPDSSMSAGDWGRLKAASPVRIQWDPERDLRLEPLQYRAIQIGVGGRAVSLYVEQWIQKITDITDLAHTIQRLVGGGQLDEAQARLPVEQAYPQLALPE